jgi:hypothetical protein
VVTDGRVTYIDFENLQVKSIGSLQVSQASTAERVPELSSFNLTFGGSQASHASPPRDDEWHE